MEKTHKEKILIANRGEIAIRIARTARRLGFGTVAVYSEADRFSEHARYCDEAYEIGKPEPKDSYLNVPKILDVAKKSGAKYVHPGFGFLSERAHFVEACEKVGLIFIGPSANSMKVMGDKIEARRTVDSLQVPRVPGSPGAVKDAGEALEFAKKVKFPVLLKAAAGGGGKGMRRVDNEAELISGFESASREALSAFGDGSMYVEKYIVEPHHVEIQVFGDGKGGAVHLHERECSVQRRHQKVWEESPSPILETHPATRKRMQEAAVRISSHINYAGAGTFEFIVDGAGDFYFLEMNTRLQVEHPVTEWVTGVDIVEWQILLAAGKLKLPPQETIFSEGSSIEVRIYAEDPTNFLPAPGSIGMIRQPNGPFLRWDSGYDIQGDVSIFYDPMIAKCSVWGRDRAHAIGRMQVALDELTIEPPKNNGFGVKGSLKTNLSFLRRLSRCEDVVKGNTTTDLIPNNPSLTREVSAAQHPEAISVEAAIAVSLLRLTESAGSTSGNENRNGMSESLWAQRARLESLK